MSNPADPAIKEELFWLLAEPMLDSGLAERSTMMGFPCLRASGSFFASLERGTGNLIVKLPAERVRELVEQNKGAHFAPNGRVFREWVLFDRADENEWASLLKAARSFVTRDG